MPDASSLYPSPPQPQQGLLSDPSKLYGFIAAAQAAKQFAAKQALGNAYQGGLNADGTVDLGKVATALKNDPNAGFVLPEATNNILAQHGQMISNDTASFDQYAKQSGFVQQWLASRANQPNVKPEDILNDAVTLSRNTDPKVLPSGVINSVIGGILGDPGGIRAGLNNTRNRVMGAAAATAPIQGPPTAGGAPTTMPLGATGQTQPGAPPSAIPGQIVTGQPQGQEITQKAAAEAAKNLEDTTTTSPLYHANLENLKQDSSVLDNLGGPTLDVERKLNALTQRVGNFGITMSPDQMKAADSFSKIANQISLQQSQAFAGTDAGRMMTVHANPSLEMSRYGRDGVIDMLQGNQDAQDTMRNIWFQAKRNGAPSNSYYDFTQTLGNEPLNPKTGAKFDPRVFQFNRMSRDNQQKFLSQVGPSELPQFEANYKEAIARKWVKPLDTSGNANAPQ
jgi:hypothetical protein